MGFFDGLNNSVENSCIGRFFKFKERDAEFTKEFKGAITSFLASAYILAVNPRILADSGGPCVAPDGNIFAEEYEDCLFEIRKQFVTSTAIASMFGCFVMGLMANYPILLSCGMGMNAYFTYSVVGWRGTGSVSYNAAVTAVLIEGGIFAVLAVTGARYAIIKFVPPPIRYGTPAGIGAFLAHLGLQTAEGLGVVVGDIATAVTLGGCPPEKRTPLVAYDEACATLGICVTSDNYTCDVEGGVMTSPTTWLGLAGLLITLVFLQYKNKGAFIFGIAFVTIISWFRNTVLTYFPDTAEGDAKFEYFKQVISIESIDLVWLQYSWEISDVAVALITFLYVDFLDTSGTLFAIVSQMGYVDEDTGDFPRSRWAFTADALATSFGSMFGISPTTSYIESAAGVEAGARTGLAAVFCGLFFFISIFFAPILASIPAWATGGSLVMVGSLMTNSLTKVNWKSPVDALSAFLAVILMPLTYSIAYGLIGSLMFYYGAVIIFKILGLFGLKLPEDEISEDKIDELDDEKEAPEEAPAKSIEMKKIEKEQNVVIPIQPIPGFEDEVSGNM